MFAAVVSGESFVTKRAFRRGDDGTTVSRLISDDPIRATGLVCRREALISTGRASRIALPSDGSARGRVGQLAVASEEAIEEEGGLICDDTTGGDGVPPRRPAGTLRHWATAA